MLRGKDNGQFCFQGWLTSPAEQREITCRVWPSDSTSHGGRKGYELICIVPIERMLGS